MSGVEIVWPTDRLASIGDSLRVMADHLSASIDERAQRGVSTSPHVVTLMRRRLNEINEQAARIRGALAGLGDDEDVERAEQVAAGYEELAAATRQRPPLAQIAAQNALILNVTWPEELRQVVDALGAQATQTTGIYVQRARSFGGLEVLVEATHDVNEAAFAGAGDIGGREAPAAGPGAVGAVAGQGTSPVPVSGLCAGAASGESAPAGQRPAGPPQAPAPIHTVGEGR